MFLYCLSKKKFVIHLRCYRSHVTKKMFKKYIKYNIKQCKVKLQNRGYFNSFIHRINYLLMSKSQKQKHSETFRSCSPGSFKNSIYFLRPVDQTFCRLDLPLPFQTGRPVALNIQTLLYISGNLTWTYQPVQSAHNRLLRTQSPYTNKIILQTPVCTYIHNTYVWKRI